MIKCHMERAEGRSRRSDWRRAVAAVRDGRVAEGGSPERAVSEVGARSSEPGPKDRVSPAYLRLGEPERYARRVSRLGAQRPDPQPSTDFETRPDTR